MGKKRLDVLLCERGMVESRQRAQALIMSGLVFMGDQRMDKAGMAVDESAELRIRGQELTYVSRGGLKLEKAMKTFPIRLQGAVCGDIGASTGGFTDCMLQNGAEKVYAVDVGYGQLAWKLRSDPRVVCLERTNARYLTHEQVPDALDFASVDVSFISLRLILPALRGLLKPGGHVVCLVKPQFEAGREKVGKKGVVREPGVHLEVLERFLLHAAETDFSVKGLTFSPIRGPEGNIEYLGYLSTGAGEACCGDLAALVAESHSTLEGEARLKVVLSPNPYRDRGLKAALRASAILEQGGIETSMCLPFSLDSGSRVELPSQQEFRAMQAELKNADMLICFGGDGTILHAARDAIAHKVPVLGVNMGSVGFMAELEHSELDLLSRVAEKKYTLEPRMMLDVVIRRGKDIVCRDLALNDAVITKGAVARVIDLDVSGDGVPIYDFSGDGVILSTPTGSTAYSMSAGGPIVEPTAENIIVTPICAHALHAKSLVLDRSRVVRVKIGRLSRKSAHLSVDGGRAFKLCSSDVVEVRRSKCVTQVVRLTQRSFYEIINQKLGRG